MPVQVYTKPPSKGGISFSEALEKSPDWQWCWIARHEHGWVFVQFDVWYAFDDGETGWMPDADDESLAIYARLGKREVNVYCEKEGS